MSEIPPLTAKHAKRSGATVGVPRNHASSPQAVVSRLGADRLSLKVHHLFDDGDLTARKLIARAFALPEVRSVVVRKEQGTVRIELRDSVDSARVWQRLSQLLRDKAFDEAPLLEPVSALDFRAPVPGNEIRISRAGNVLTTFRVRLLDSTQVRLAHPLLRRRDIFYRVREMLASVHGVSEVRGSPLSGRVLVDYDPELLEVDQLLRLLDSSWARFLAGFLPPPLPRKLAIAGSLLAFSAAAQFFNPALLPWAMAAVVVYSSPNLFAALADLVRGRVGLPALYSAGLGLLLWSWLPFASSVVATLYQAWPTLERRLAAGIERRLFAEQRRQLVWARLVSPDTNETIVDVSRLHPGAIVAARAGDYLPADGAVVAGLAAVEEHALLGGRRVTDKITGDTVYAGCYVRDGAITVRVERAGAKTVFSQLAEVLPHGSLTGLGSSAEAERIANRNAKPALALGAAALLITRTPRLAQVIIRPDYVTAPRLSSHLSALAGLAECLRGGVLLRNPAVLERLVAPNLYIFDDGTDFSKRDIAVAGVRAWDRAAARETLALATAAFHDSDDPRAPALSRETRRRKIERPSISGRKRLAGAVRFLDEAGSLVTIATLDHLHWSGLTGAIAAVAALPSSPLEPAKADGTPRPLIILRGRELLGTVSFARRGAAQVASAVSLLRSRNPEIRFVHLSSLPQEAAEERAADVRFDAVFGNLSPSGKAEAIKSLGSRSIWIGDGTDPACAMARLASDVSVSVSKLDRFQREQADIALLCGDLKSLVVALEAADHHLKRLRADYRTVYFANGTALLGGFLAGFGSLRAGLVSNLGTAAVFLARWRALEEIAKEFSRRSHSRGAETNFAFGTREAHPRSLSAKFVRASRSTQ